MDFEGNIVSLVSVILPTYNRASLLSRAIKSVLRQSYANWELIIIDDGSSDETARVVEQYLTDSRIKYLYKANSGAGDSRNFGLIKAKGDWITFLDSDDEFHEDKIKHQLETALATGSKFIVCGSVYFKDGVEFRKKIPSQKPNLKYALLNKEASTGVSTPIYFIASKLLKSNSIQFDASLPAFQDWDLLYQIADITNYEVVKEHLYTVHFQRAGRVHSMKNVLLAHRLLLCKYQYDFAGDLEAKRKWVGMVLTLGIRTTLLQWAEVKTAWNVLKFGSFMTATGRGIFQLGKVTLYKLLK